MKHVFRYPLKVCDMLLLFLDERQPPELQELALVHNLQHVEYFQRYFASSFDYNSFGGFKEPAYIIFLRTMFIELVQIPCSNTLLI